MTKSSSNDAIALFSELVLEVFRVNGKLLAVGDRLTADLGLTSARWQVMGAIGNDAIPVGQIARKMGLKRQSVQRLVNVLADEGIVEFRDNPHHQRAKLVQLTDAGHQRLEQISHIQNEWAGRVSDGLEIQQLRDAIHLLQDIQARL